MKKFVTPLVREPVPPPLIDSVLRNTVNELTSAAVKLSTRKLCQIWDWIHSKGLSVTYQRNELLSERRREKLKFHHKGFRLDPKQPTKNSIIIENQKIK